MPSIECGRAAIKWQAVPCIEARGSEIWISLTPLWISETITMWTTGVRKDACESHLPGEDTHNLAVVSFLEGHTCTQLG